MSTQRSPKTEVSDEQTEGTRPCFFLEVTSKNTARYDRTSKPKIYRQGKVAEIFLLDRLKSPWVLSGERRNPTTRRYLKIRADKRGRLLSEKLGVYLSVSASGDELILEDAETGEVLRTPVKESEDRRATERQAAEEAEARQAAEARVTEEAKARRKEAVARAAAEAMVQELMAKIQRLESPTTESPRRPPGPVTSPTEKGPTPDGVGPSNATSVFGRSGLQRLAFERLTVL